MQNRFALFLDRISEIDYLPEISVFKSTKHSKKKKRVFFKEMVLGYSVSLSGLDKHKNSGRSNLIFPG